MKKVLSVILTFFVLFMCFLFVFTVKAKAFGITYTVKADGSCYVSDCPSNASGDIVIKSVLPDGKIVTGIGEGAFFGCNSITSITIPDTVTTIGSRAFYGCESLKLVNISDCVTSIGERAFYDCSSLSNITLPIGLSSVSDYTFFGCSSLKSIKIPSSVKNIGENAFSECTKLTEVHITDIASWCNISFDSYKDNPLYYAQNLYLNNELLTELVIPKGIKYIKDYAFYNCNSIVSVTIPDSVTTVGSCAFENCNSLSSVLISDIAKWCGIEFDVASSNPLYCAQNLYLNNSFLTELVIPEGVKYIKDYAFYNCNSIESITMPDSIISIGRWAFEKCCSLSAVFINNIAKWCAIEFADLSSNPLLFAEALYLSDELVVDLIIPHGVERISSNAFSGCTSIESVLLPNSIFCIDDSAFRNCISLKSIVVSKNLAKIGFDAFYCCNALEIVNITDIAKWCEIVFDGMYSNPVTYSNSLYLHGDVITKLKIPDDVIEIKDYAFYNCCAISKLQLGENVKQIGVCAFAGCSALIEAAFSNNLTKITASSFANCNMLTQIKIPKSLTEIDSCAFLYCDSIEYVFYDGSEIEWAKLEIGDYNESLTSTKIHYNATGHSHSCSTESAPTEQENGKAIDTCPVCGFINGEEDIVYINNYITAVDTKNAVVDTTSNTLLLDMSACKDINEAIVEMDGYTLTTIPTSSYGFIGTGSKLQVADSTGTQVVEYTLVVRGDVNGDSVCDSLDLMLIELARQTNNNVSLEGAYFAAANLAEDSEINIDDFNAVVNKAVA